MGMAGVLRNRPDCKVGIDIGEQEMIDGGNPKALVDHAIFAGNQELGQLLQQGRFKELDSIYMKAHV